MQPTPEKRITEPAPKSKTVLVRLRAEEVEMLRYIAGPRSTSEALRLLLHREYSRRTTGSSIVPDSAVATDWRIGRPKQAASS